MLSTVALAEEVTYIFKGADLANIIASCEEKVQERNLQGEKQFEGIDAVYEWGRRQFRNRLNRYENEHNPIQPIPHKDNAITVKK